MEPERDHISVCICTYKRPQMLGHLLNELQKQQTDNAFTYSAVIVDNDYTQSAKDIVVSLKENSLINIDYYCEPEQNIALARNKAVENAKGDFIAFIDDDEFPDDNWLRNLHKANEKYHADGVLGPVKPHFEIDPPQWIIKGKLCERDSFDTGTILRNAMYTRTGNTLLKKEIFKEANIPFDPKYGKTGGEDVDFFKRMIERGHVFVWCNEASVYETVPPARLKRAYFLKRALMRGLVNSQNSTLISLDALKSAIAFTLYTTALPFLLLIGHHLFMRYLIKDCDHIGKLLGFFGITIIKKRSF